MDSAQLEAARREAAALRSENERLHERIAALEDALMGVRLLPLEWKLTGQEQRVLGVLINRDLASKEAIMAALYGSRPDGDVAGAKIVDVFICKARKKLRPYGIEIQTVWAQGYRLPKEVRDRYRREHGERYLGLSQIRREVRP